MAKLTIDFKPDNLHLVFRQEGRKGFALPLAWLPEFLEAFEKPSEFEVVYFWTNYGVRRDKKSATLVLSTQETPLLHLDAEQIPKLIASLRERFKDHL